jgi:hypothetical protein
VPVIGSIYSNLLSGHFLLTYLAFALVPFTWWVLYRTRFGLRLRAVGENPGAVDTAGISVTWMRYRAVICCGILCGIAGAYLSMAMTAGFVKGMTAGKGFIALAALIFAKWKPVNVMFACLLFGFLDAMSIRMQGNALPADRRGAGAVHAGLALHPDRCPAGRLHRQGDPAQGRWRALRQGALRCPRICSKPPAMRWRSAMRPIPSSLLVRRSAPTTETSMPAANIEVLSFPEGWCAETTAIGAHGHGRRQADPWKSR